LGGDVNWVLEGGLGWVEGWEGVPGEGSVEGSGEAAFAVEEVKEVDPGEGVMVL